MSDNLESDIVDKSVQDFTSFLFNEVSTVMSKTIKVQHSTQSKKPQNKWFDENYASARREFKRAQNTFIKNKNDVNRVLFTQSKTHYSRCKRKAKVKFKLSEGKRVCDLAKSKPHEFWANVNKYIKAKKKTKKLQKHCQARTF